MNGPVGIGGISLIHYQCFNIQSGTEFLQVGLAVLSYNGYTHRHTLLNLHEVARGIVGRNLRISQARGRTERLNHTFICNARNGIGSKLNGIAYRDVLQLCFAIVGNNPHLIVVYNTCEHLSGLNELTYMNVLAAHNLLTE